jgi:predicted transposase YdaD
MFEWVKDFDIQETRRVARDEGVELAGDIMVALKQGLSVEAIAKKLKTNIETVKQLKEKII